MLLFLRCMANHKGTWVGWLALKGPTFPCINWNLRPWDRSIYLWNWEEWWHRSWYWQRTPILWLWRRDSTFRAILYDKYKLNDINNKSIESYQPISSSIRLILYYRQINYSNKFFESYSSFYSIFSIPSKSGRG